MAKTDTPKPVLSQDVPLPPGCVVTPDYEVTQRATNSGFSDRRINADGSIVDLSYTPEHLSTYDGAKPQRAEGAPEIAAPVTQTQPGVQG